MVAGAQAHSGATLLAASKQTMIAGGVPFRSWPRADQRYQLSNVRSFGKVGHRRRSL